MSVGVRDLEAGQIEDGEYVAMQGTEVRVMLKIKYLKYWLRHNNSGLNLSHSSNSLRTDGAARVTTREKVRAGSKFVSKRNLRGKIREFHQAPSDVLKDALGNPILLEDKTVI